MFRTVRGEEGKLLNLLIFFPINICLDWAGWWLAPHYLILWLCLTVRTVFIPLASTGYQYSTDNTIIFSQLTLSLQAIVMEASRVREHHCIIVSSSHQVRPLLCNNLSRIVKIRVLFSSHPVPALCPGCIYLTDIDVLTLHILHIIYYILHIYIILPTLSSILTNYIID